ncbi:oxygen-independent coproporphyrinogen-3 oxidase [Hydrogenivirga caldilitoris]|uniref:Heme chaperone HemW n=1 Tax=Hydrogenivirga caldilitoris TaxID=246264 RepID=A0A497XQ43_9AQUI|nr:radical SAM family heme chaperone HemW [Hydrogenivirga caldilitoris]RLJ71097.1 oxygen-independent coproporphyrinogen-3 oxidase [Hydrogenivirga caldilitoris]
MVKGIYIHIPFCSYKCPYCDFTSVVSYPLKHEDYIKLLIREAKLYGDVSAKIESVYFGGGTPTLLPPYLLGKLLEELDRLFNLSGVLEITVECNPETYRYNEFKELLSAGVNRLSIGVQSFTEKGLRILSREHSVEESIRAYMDAREAGFENVNLDLIFAFPEQKPEDISTELNWIGSLKPDHVSAYMLTPYGGTPMGNKILGGEMQTPEEETLEDIYTRLWKGLKELGYGRYEISNWAKEGKECRHNLLYWTMEEFLGLGVSAWGFLEKKRYGNSKNIGSYIKAVSELKRPVQSEIGLSEKELYEEELMLKLRLKWGLREEELTLVPEHLRGFFEVREGKVGIREEFMLLTNELITDVLLYNSDRNITEVRNG